MKNTAKKERCKDCEMMSEYFESHFITVDFVADMLGVSTKTIERWQSREKDPLPLDIRGGKGRPSLYHIARICEWGLRQAVRKAGYTVYPLL
jgi:transposase